MSHKEQMKALQWTEENNPRRAEKEDTTLYRINEKPYMYNPKVVPNPNKKLVKGKLGA